MKFSFDPMGLFQTDPRDLRLGALPLIVTHILHFHKSATPLVFIGATGALVLFQLKIVNCGLFVTLRGV